jgi:hypothetical protein
MKPNMTLRYEKPKDEYLCRLSVSLARFLPVLCFAIYPVFLPVLCFSQSIFPNRLSVQQLR